MFQSIMVTYVVLQQQNQEGFDVPFWNQLGLVSKAKTKTEHDGRMLGPNHVPPRAMEGGMPTAPALTGVPENRAR